MVLEDRGVGKKTFKDLQDAAIAEIHMSSDRIMQCRQLFRDHSLGQAFKLPFLLRFLHEVGLGMQYERSKFELNDPFFDNLVLYAKNSVLRSLKHAARIPVKDSWLLVGVADEGPAYEKEGYQDVYKLQEGEIFGASSFGCIVIYMCRSPMQLVSKDPMISSQSSSKVCSQYHQIALR